MTGKIQKYAVATRHALRRISPYANVAGEVARAAMTSQRGALGTVAGVLASAVRTASTEAVYSQWAVLYDGRASRPLVQAMSGLPAYPVNGNTCYKLADIEVLVNDTALFVTPGTEVEAARLVRARVMQVYGAHMRMVVGRDAAATVELMRDDRRGLSSDTAKAIVDRVAVALQRQGRRSVLLYGPHGTGKTTAALYVASRLAKSWLAVGASGSRALGDVWAVCKTLAPEALLLDDIERFEDIGCLLDVLESPERPPLVLLTSNAVPGSGGLPGAVTRCKRVDESYELTGHPSAWARIGVLASLPDDVWREIQGWSVASLQEVATRLELFGMDGLRLDELRLREAADR